MATFLNHFPLKGRGSNSKKGDFFKAKNKIEDKMMDFKIQTSDQGIDSLLKKRGVTAYFRMKRFFFNKLFYFLISVGCVAQMGFSEIDPLPTPEVILKNVVERETATRKALESWQYHQVVRNWIEKKQGVKIDSEEDQMRVRPRSESSFMILNPLGEWIHGGTPDNEAARKGRNIQRNLEIASLNTLRERFDFKGVGKEKRGEIEVYRFRLISKSDFKPKNRIDKVMKEVEGDLWVDLSDYSVMGVEGRLLRSTSVAWLFATIETLRFEYQTQVLPIGRVMSGFDLDLKLKGMGGSSTRYRQVRMTEYQSNPGQDIW